MPQTMPQSQHNSSCRTVCVLVAKITSVLESPRYDDIQGSSYNNYNIIPPRVNLFLDAMKLLIRKLLVAKVNVLLLQISP